MNENQQLQTTTTSLLSRVAGRFGIEPGRMVQTLKATAFRGEVTNEQMTALLVIADQYQLNPWTREIYAFPDRKAGGIVPVIGVDGWMRIINSHPQMDGVQFEEDGESCTCTIHRKDRSHPVRVTEYLSECRRNTEPWQSHPKRMLRHKALIQCARLAFGFGAIYDPDEAERIIESRQAEIVQSVAELQPEEPKPTPIERAKAKLKATKPANVPPPEVLVPTPPVIPCAWYGKALAYGQQRGLDAQAVTEIIDSTGASPFAELGSTERSVLMDRIEDAARKHAEIEQAKAPVDGAGFPTRGEDLLEMVGSSNDWLAKLKPLVLGSLQSGNRRAVSMWKHMDEDEAFSEQATPSLASLQAVCDAVNAAIKEG